MMNTLCAEMPVRHPIDVAAICVGGRANLAALLRVSQSAVGNWKERGTPLEHCPYIEQFTEGAVTCEELRPDMAAYFALIRELAPAQRCRPESDALPDAAVVGQGA